MSAGDPSITDLAVRLVGSLAVVVGLMLLIARGVNRRFKAPSGAAIQVVHRQSLGRGIGVAVVSVGTRVLVVGTTEQQVSLLAEVEPDEIGLELAATEQEASAEYPGAPRHKRISSISPEEPTNSLVRMPVAGGGTGALAGSVLSPQTWKQTLAAFTGNSGTASSEGDSPGVVPPRRRAS